MLLASRSRPPKTASLRRVALLLLVCFGILEVFTRFKLVEMSKDLRRFKTYPARAAQLHAAPRLRVALLGNSATERAIDLPALQRELAARKIAASLDIFTADASHLNSWQPMATHLFWTPKTAPDVLVVPFFNRSLEDANTIETGRLAQFFTSPSEMPQTLRDLPDAASRLDFAISSVWATYATRARLKERVLSLIVPDYRGFTANLSAAATPAIASQKGPTYRHLERLACDARANGCRLVFVALPWRNPLYPFARSLPARARNAGAGWLDLRALPGLQPSLFADSIHFNPQGRAFFTPRLARALAELLPAPTR